ncbi:DUF932 domain-containing protein [Chamaesiphon minutus]|uniref:DUF932 domain-containing protein n=1 Tax=Chamaesiphon minutus (strain ATCC 27169 / PCC 6605) TaxID=1173020 RepID=K9URK5_CHAP6|nr:DUF932 domain-containing protein [Chamaesiphon minutus]AFY97101.1 protein of unknown function (DUF932) [Chamaesiphon minutus PCC 6605]
MKTGRTIVELAQELLEQQETKRDFHASTKSLTMVPSGKFQLETTSGLELMPATAYAHAQMASKLSIPKVYYDRMMRQSPDLLAENVNHWLDERQDETSLIRTLRGQMRAFLSSRYRIVDNHEILAMVLPELSEMGSGIKIASCQVTDERMYLKVINTDIEAAIAVGDPVQAGFILSNGEIGNSSISVEPFIMRLACTNGLILKDKKQRKNHAGRSAENSDLYAIDTIQAIDDAFKLKVRDLVRNAISISTFQEAVADMQGARYNPITGNPVKAVEVTARSIGLSENESGLVLKHLIDAGDLSQFGMLNAVTRTAEDIGSYDRATEVERLGSSVLYLPTTTWLEIATANS